MTEKKIYADLGNLRHTDFAVVRKRDGDIFSQPLEVQRALDHVRKYREKELSALNSRI